MSKWHPGQLLFVGFEGTRVPGDLKSRIEEGRVGGVVLFSRNLRDPRQVHTLMRELHEPAPKDAPLIVAIDQEGGRVQRLPEPWTRWPSMRRVAEVGERGDARHDPTRDVARAIATELRDLGIGLDFAPVVDVDSNPENPVIGDRSFGRDEGLVSGHGEAFIEAMQAGGVAACAKHFPGHGDTNTDSHLELPRLEHDVERLRRVELPPFRAAVNAKVASIMTAHVLFPRLDAKRPATMAPDVIHILRSELAYDGFVFTDDLEMGAVADHFSVEQRCMLPLRAGVDGLLVCRHADLREEMLTKLERAPDSIVEHALRRVVALKENWRVTPSENRPPYEPHQSLADRLAGPD